jgi:Flp pilus assembly protein TadD
MKALEQAAKDRGEARNEPTASAAPSPGDAKPELSLALELLADDKPAAHTRADAAPKPRPAASGATTAREQASAASVMQAGGRFDDYRRVNPVIVFGALVGMFAVGFAIYVYLQIYHPGFFARRTPSAQPAAPVAQSVPPAGSATAPSPPIPASAVLPPATVETREPSVAVAAPPAPKPAAPATAPPAASAAPSKIVVSRGTAAATVNPVLTEAYNAVQAGNMDAAQRLYAEVARAEPRSIDALLGLAAAASVQGRNDEATRHYLRILELDPRHALAQSGLIGLLGRGDPLGAETRLKQLIAREPSAFLYFTLGNLYADQSLWAQAQQAYFQAHHLDPGNPDYAYNLAVGLEHLGQQRLALGFYRQAEALATGRGHASFNRAQAQDRISRLAAQLE